MKRKNGSFPPLVFANETLDAINLGKYIHNKSVRANVSPYIRST
jgi:SAM-dependent MidA family methyltransferase